MLYGDYGALFGGKRVSGEDKTLDRELLRRLESQRPQESGCLDQSVSTVATWWRC